MLRKTLIRPVGKKRTEQRSGHQAMKEQKADTNGSGLLGAGRDLIRWLLSPLQLSGRFWRRVMWLTLFAAMVLVAHHVLALGLLGTFPFEVALVLLGASLLVALALGLTDLHSIVDLVTAPILTAGRYFRHLLAATLAVGFPALLLDISHPAAQLAGMFGTCVAFAFLGALLVGPHRVSGFISSLSSNLHTWNTGQKELLFRFLRGRGQGFDELVPKMDQAALGNQHERATEAARRWEKEDVSSPKDIGYNATGWFTAWICLFLILNTGSLFRSAYILQTMGGPELLGWHIAQWYDVGEATEALDSALSWLMLGVEAFLLRGEITFDFFDVYGLQTPSIMGNPAVSFRPGGAMSLLRFLCRISIGLMLANVVFSHFAFGRDIGNLVSAGANGRAAERFRSRPYRSLRLLRPLIEARLLRLLRRSVLWSRLSAVGHPDPLWSVFGILPRRLLSILPSVRQKYRWDEVLCILSVLRTGRSRRVLLCALADETVPFQVRLAALNSLAAMGADVPCGSLCTLLAGLSTMPGQSGFRKQYGPLSGLSDFEKASDRELVSAWTEDLLAVTAPVRSGAVRLLPSVPGHGKAANGIAGAFSPAKGCPHLLSHPGRSQCVLPEDKDKFAATLRALACTTRVEILDLLVLLPDHGEDIASVLARHGHLGPPLAVAEKKVLQVLHRISSDPLNWATAVKDLSTMSVPKSMTQVVTRVLLRLLRMRPEGAGSAAAYDCLASQATGTQALRALCRRWNEEGHPERWLRLLKGMERIGITGDEEVLNSLVKRLGDGSLKEDFRLSIWRLLCLKAPDQFLEEHLGLRSRRTHQGAVLRWVPPGDTEVAGRRYSVAGFWAADFPVTVAQWMEFERERSSLLNSDSPDPVDYLRCIKAGVTALSLPESPVVEIAWHHAAAYCRWLTRREREGAKLDEGLAYRLPTEVEWQRMAEGRILSLEWVAAARIPDQLNCRDTQPIHGTVQRGCYPPNALGLFDLLGNVWEWCANEHGFFDLQRHASGLSCRLRALRGGAWRSPTDACHVHLRAGWSPIACLDHIGLRIVLAPEADKVAQPETAGL